MNVPSGHAIGSNIPDDFGRDTTGRGIIRYIFGDNRTRGNDGIFAESDARQYGDACADPDALFYMDGSRHKRLPVGRL